MHLSFISHAGMTGPLANENFFLHVGEYCFEFVFCKCTCLSLEHRNSHEIVNPFFCALQVKQSLFKETTLVLLYLLGTSIYSDRQMIFLCSYLKQISLNT